MHHLFGGAGKLGLFLLFLISFLAYIDVSRQNDNISKESGRLTEKRKKWYKRTVDKKSQGFILFCRIRKDKIFVFAYITPPYCVTTKWNALKKESMIYTYVPLLKCS
jgi:diphthamide synthase subunit DPH2